MDQASIQTAVAALEQARATMTTISALPSGCAPETMEEGYAIQDACMAAHGKDIIGWKVGATNPAALELFGIDEPFLGPIFEGDTNYTSPATIDGATLHHYCVESEFAFLLSHPIDGATDDLSDAALMACVGEVVPVFELISPRFDGVPKGNGPAAAADCGLCGGLVIGKMGTPLSDVDLLTHAATLTVAGEKKGEGNGALVMGNPINALRWTAEKLATRGRILERGMFVSTGTLTGVTFVERGQHCVADFGTLGTVEVTFT